MSTSHSNPGSVAPHAALPEYYGSAEARQPWVNELFDRNAGHYDLIGKTMSLGSGAWYRRSALHRAGLRPGMKLLDVATGTGLVAQAALELNLAPTDVVGLDASLGMLLENRRNRAIPLVRGVGQRLPFDDGRFDFITMGYALRHVPDLVAMFREFHRVLKPGGTVCVLEITKPRSSVARFAWRKWMQSIVPRVARLRRRNADAGEMMRYYWDTIEKCIPPAAILEAMHSGGLRDVKRQTSLAIFSEYTAHRA